MEKARLAVIDLGTNTFHLLILESSDETWKEIYRERTFVNLAEGGIETIGQSAWDRGMQALTKFATLVKDYKCQTVKPIGTAALRRAANRQQFVQAASNLLGSKVQVIDGMTEAAYICSGVNHALPASDRDLLIMDIGGGSVEFIIYSNDQVQFSGSYPIGVAVLYDAFHKTEPIAESDKSLLKAHLDHILKPVRAACRDFDTLHLVGASGSFEVLDIAIAGQLETASYAEYNCADFKGLFQEVVGLDLESRLAHPGIPDSRAKYVVCALFLMNYVMEMIDARSMSISNYALKEGVAEEWLNSLD